MKKAFSYLVIFIGLQILGGAIIDIAWKLFSGNSDMTATKLIVTTAVISVVTILLFILAKWAQVSPAWIRTRPWVVLAWSCVAALGAIIPSSWIQEQIPELPNIVENEFELILKDRWGYLTIGLLAPLSEELVFRGTILKSLLSSSRLSAWGAIAISALLFALIHMNPAQMPHAFIIGLLLGWMYYRTGSILPGMAYHWVNNSAAYVIFNVYPDPDIKLVDVFKGSETNVYLAVGCSLLILFPALYQLHLWMRRAND